MDEFDAIVDANAIEPSAGVYRRVSDALNDAPENSTKPYRIYLKHGRYYEKLIVAKPFIAFIGQARAKTIITYDTASDTKKSDGTTYGTTGSASITIRASDFHAENLTIENSFDYNANAAKPVSDPVRFANAQAVALKTEKPSDRTVFKNVAFNGFQDTLYVDAGRHYFDHCTISGNIDFIFGAGQAAFDHCDIVSRGRGYITAASTLLSDPFGFLFSDCRLLKMSPDLADDSVALGRPWHPTNLWADGTRSANPNAVGCVVFKHCWMDSHIRAEGWDSMKGRDKGGNTITFVPSDARFFESGSTGPGAIASNLRRVLSESDAKKYSIENILGDWVLEK